jgi:hypothetical protein
MLLHSPLCGFNRVKNDDKNTINKNLDSIFPVHNTGSLTRFKILEKTIRLIRQLIIIPENIMGRFKANFLKK